jgi:hypothetical protein
MRISPGHDVLLTVVLTPDTFLYSTMTRPEAIMPAYVHPDGYKISFPSPPSFRIEMPDGRCVDAPLPMEIIPEHSFRSVDPVVRQISRRVSEEKIEAPTPISHGHDE